MIYLDTHVLVVMYEGDVRSLGKKARHAIDTHDLMVSPASVLELEYLHEIRRLKIPAETIIDALATDVGLRVCDLTFDKVVTVALAENWTRDACDRLIVASAKAREIALVTKDEKILKHYPRAIW